MDVLQNRFVVDLKCGYDMPMDSQYQMTMMPSVYCECSYSAIPATPLQQQSSVSVPQSRNPLWNQTVSLGIQPHHIDYEAWQHRGQWEEALPVEESMIVVKGNL